MMKKIISFLAIVTILSTSIVPSTIEAKSTSLQTSQKIAQKYSNVKVKNLSLKDVNTSTCIKINSNAEYEKLLKSLNSKNLEQSINLNSSDFSSYAGSKKLTSKTSSRWIGSVPGVPPVKINMNFAYTRKKVKGKWTFDKISNKKSWLTGLEFPVAYTWNCKSFNHSLSKSKQKATFTLKGTLSVTVLFKGLPQLMTTNNTYKFNYNIK